MNIDDPFTLINSELEKDLSYNYPKKFHFIEFKKTSSNSLTNFFFIIEHNYKIIFKDIKNFIELIAVHFDIKNEKIYIYENKNLKNELDFKLYGNNTIQFKVTNKDGKNLAHYLSFCSSFHYDLR
jgi:hypothetical protein